VNCAQACFDEICVCAHEASLKWKLFARNIGLMQSNFLISPTKLADTQPIEPKKSSAEAASL
jgi:hypothetical protein